MLLVLLLFLVWSNCIQEIWSHVILYGEFVLVNVELELFYQQCYVDTVKLYYTVFYFHFLLISFLNIHIIFSLFVRPSSLSLFRCIRVRFYYTIFSPSLLFTTIHLLLHAPFFDIFSTIILFASPTIFN